MQERPHDTGRAHAGLRAGSHCVPLRCPHDAPRARAYPSAPSLQVVVHLEPPHDDGRISTALHAAGFFPATTRLQAVVAGLPTTISTLMASAAQAGRATRRHAALELELLNAVATSDGIQDAAPRFNVLTSDAGLALSDVVALSRNPCRLEFKLLRGGQPVFLDGLIAAAAESAAALPQHPAGPVVDAAGNGSVEHPPLAEELEHPDAGAANVAAAPQARTPVQDTQTQAEEAELQGLRAAPNTTPVRAQQQGRQVEQVSCAMNTLAT